MQVDLSMGYAILTVELVNPHDLARRVEVDAYIDSGCSRSLFDGRLAMMVGIDPTRGPTALHQRHRS